MLQIIKAETAEHYRQTQYMFQQYAASLEFNLESQEFDKEVNTLPGAYAPPAGCILLAAISGQFVGCVAFRKIGESICEMKRLFVLPQYRADGIGRLLARSIIAEAEKTGYQQMRLDTVASMTAANALYASLGFQAIEPYCYNPLEDAAYYELTLSQEA